MPPMQPEQKKKKKRITPELIAGPGAQAMGPQMGAPATVEAVKSKKQKTGSSSTGYLRVKRAAEDQGATLQALRQVFLLFISTNKPTGSGGLGGPHFPTLTWGKWPFESARS